MILSFSLFSTLSVIIGIDLGTENLKVSMTSTGKGTHVAQNQQGQRLTPTYFSIWNINNITELPQDHWTTDDIEQLDWCFFSFAKSRSINHPNTTFRGIFPLTEKFGGIYKQEAFALMIHNLLSQISPSKIDSHQYGIVLAVDPSLSITERLAALESVSLSNTSVQGITDSITSVAYTYGLEKTLSFTLNTKNVMFLNIGARSSWCSIFKYQFEESNPVGEELAYDFDPELGGDLIDNLLYNYIEKKISNLYHTIKRDFLFEEIQKAKTLLTIHDEAFILIDEESEFKYKITRNEMEQEIELFAEKLTDMVSRTFDMARLNFSDINTVELIGGCTRVPLVRKVLEKLLGKDRTSRTMNADEAIALGAGYIGVRNSREFLVKNITIRSFCRQKVKLYQKKKKLGTLFQEFNWLNKNRTKVITVKGLKHFSLRIGKVKILKFDLMLKPPSLDSKDTEDPDEIRFNKQKFEVKFKFGFRSFSVPSVYSAYIVDGHIKCTIGVQETYSYLGEKNKSQYSNYVRAMEESYFERYRKDELKNELEAEIYKVNEKFNGSQSLAEVMTPEESTQLFSLLQSIKEFLQTSHTMKEYRKQLMILQRDAYEPDFKANEYKNRPIAIEKLNKSIILAERALSKTWPVTRPWLPKSALHEFAQLINETKLWLHDKLRQQSCLSITDIPAVTVIQLDSKRAAIEEPFLKFMKMKKPLPGEEIEFTLKKKDERSEEIFHPDIMDDHSVKEMTALKKTAKKSDPNYETSLPMNEDGAKSRGL